MRPKTMPKTTSMIRKIKTFLRYLLWYSDAFSSWTTPSSMRSRATSTLCSMLSGCVINVKVYIGQSRGGGGAHPKKKNQKKNPKKQKKPSQFANFGVATGFFGFFWLFLVFFWFFWFFCDGILTLNSNTKKNQKIPKKNQKNQKKNQKKPKRSQKTSFQSRMLAKAYAKKKPKKPKKTKIPKKNSFQFRFLAKTNAKKTKKSQKNRCQFGNFRKTKKKPKKKPMPIYRFWCSDWFFFGWAPPPPPIKILSVSWMREHSQNFYS